LLRGTIYGLIYIYVLRKRSNKHFWTNVSSPKWKTRERIVLLKELFDLFHDYSTHGFPQNFSKERKFFKRGKNILFAFKTPKNILFLSKKDNETLVCSLLLTPMTAIGFVNSLQMTENAKMSNRKKGTKDANKNWR